MLITAGYEHIMRCTCAFSLRCQIERGTLLTYVPDTKEDDGPDGEYEFGPALCMSKGGR